MRFKLIMQLKEKRFPVDYRRVIMSFIKKALSNVDNGKYMTKFYKDTIPKNFCFSVEFPKPNFQKDEIVLEGSSITIKFSTSDKKTSFYLQNILMSQINAEFKIPTNNSMTLKKIIKENKDIVIRSDKVVFKTSKGNGICIRKHMKEDNKDTYFVYDDEGFEEQFKEVVKNQALKAGFNESISENIKFIPIKCKKVLVKHYSVYVPTTVGFFELDGDSSLLQYLYDVGLGSRHSENFGMLEIVNQI